MTSTEAFFDALKSHRESQNIEISEICEFTKINKKYIQAIESGDFTVLPTVYMHLFLRAYAEFIGADSAKSLEDFELLTTGTIQKNPDIKWRTSEKGSQGTAWLNHSAGIGSPKSFFSQEITVAS